LEPVLENVPHLKICADRIMYGSDFPNIPFAWDRELRRLQAAGLSDGALERILHNNVAEFFNLHPLGESRLVPPRRSC
jgi:predicted TIM-barrel fold metal-dependent hydrolase